MSEQENKTRTFSRDLVNEFIRCAVTSCSLTEADLFPKSSSTASSTVADEPAPSSSINDIYDFLLQGMKSRGMRCALAEESVLEQLRFQDPESPYVELVPARIWFEQYKQFRPAP